MTEQERIAQLEQDVEEYDGILGRQGDLLTGVANALRGQPPELTTWSHHDLPERAQALLDERDTLLRTALTKDERNEAIAALYDRLFEAKRYVADSKRTIEAHQDHQTCCISGLVDREREHLAAFKQRRDSIVGALRKMGENP